MIGAAGTLGPLSGSALQTTACSTGRTSSHRSSCTAAVPPCPGWPHSRPEPGALMVMITSHLLLASSWVPHRHPLGRCHRVRAGGQEGPGPLVTEPSGSEPCSAGHVRFRSHCQSSSPGSIAGELSWPAKETVLTTVPSGSLDTISVGRPVHIRSLVCPSRRRIPEGDVGRTLGRLSPQRWRARAENLRRAGCLSARSGEAKP